MTRVVATAVSRRVIYRVVGALVVGTVLWLVLRPNEERVVGSALRELCENASWDKRVQPAGHFATMRERIEADTTSDLVVRIPDAPDLGGGRLAVLRGLHELYERESHGVLSIDHVQVAVDADRNAARAVADATLLLETGEHTVTDTRKVAIRLQRRDGTWRVAFVDVAAKPKDQPEARP